jgi:hypothetical protein
MTNRRETAMYNRDAFLVHERTNRLLAEAVAHRLTASPHADESPVAHDRHRRGWAISRGFASLLWTILGPRAA